MDAGIAQENGALQNITLQINPGEVFVVPQGLLHYNHNRQCTPNAFFQSFNSADPGALTVTNALAALKASGEAGAAAALASTTDQVMKSDFAAFALDQECLAHCDFPETGAPNDGLDDLPADFKVLFGL
jgi:Cupin